MRLSGLRLNVQKPKLLAGFYADHFGMTARRDGEIWRVGYPGQDADLVLFPDGPAFAAKKSDQYWKIGITLPNVDMAVVQLRAKGIEVSEPWQFLDIGYMCHLQDSEGFVIELLQHDFQTMRPDHAGDATLPLGGGARIGQITLRTGGIMSDLSFYEGLGMRPLSIQPVPDFGFDLYFLAFTDETPPDPDLLAIHNREWLWKRPYTVLEFQHVPGALFGKTPALNGLEIEGLNGQITDPHNIQIWPASR